MTEIAGVRTYVGVRFARGVVGGRSGGGDGGGGGGGGGKDEVVVLVGRMRW